MSSPDGPRLLALWSPPRSRSTAFFRMMAQRGDFRMFHEPFSDLAAGQPYTVGDRTLRSPGELFSALVDLSEQAPVFFKDTTEYRHVQLFDDLPLAARAVHTFIIRDPRAAIESHYAMNSEVTLPEIGYEHLYEVFERVRQETGRTPAVLDADILVEHPAETIRAYCEAVGIGYDDGALSWSPGERSEWARTSRWHQDVAESSGFRPTGKQYEVTVDTDERLAGYHRHHLPFYEALRAAALGAPTAG